MLGQLLALAKNAFVESLRQPIYLLLLLLAGVLQLLNTAATGFSMGYTDSSEISQGDDKLLLDIGLASVFVFGTLLAAFTATAVVSREIEAKTVLTVISKPVGRPVVILGKYLGVAGAILIAVLVMLLYLLIALRHGVMWAAWVKPDQPAIIFSLAAVVLALGLGAWTNFFYGWSFPQAASLFLALFLVVAYLALLVVSPKWELQPIFEDQWLRGPEWMSTQEYIDEFNQHPAEVFIPGNIREGDVKGHRLHFPTFKPQVAMACAALALAVLVLTAVAVAVSTRLGQVMTIAVCAGVFVLGLLSNHLLGRLAYVNTPIGRVQIAQPDMASRANFGLPGDEYQLVLERAPVQPLEPGMAVHYGANPNGFRLATRSSQAGAPAEITRATLVDMRIRRTEHGSISRPPTERDYLFLKPTTIQPAYAAIHAVIPNMQHFWLLDAVTQNNPIPMSHLARLAGYAGAYTLAFLSLGVVLFQTRDVT